MILSLVLRMGKYTDEHFFEVKIISFFKTETEKGLLRIRGQNHIESLRISVIGKTRHLHLVLPMTILMST